ncbi:MAG TPA: GNAT family N-acetyltransferase [Casimicrobiaceae bacterium]|nr:GNAT family N-acetyltransferase [Casimicrobiaceae bacterium]
MTRAIEAIRIEEAGLNALQTTQQLFYDGWLLRLSPGKAKRARSVNPHFGSSLPLDGKIDHCERVYRERALPVLFRMTPFATPDALGAALEARGYVAFDSTLVQIRSLEDVPPLAPRTDVVLASPPIAEFVEAVGELRGSTAGERAAHFERVSSTPLAMCAIVANADGRAVAAGQASIDGGLAGIYDMMTAAAWRGRGLASLIIEALLAWAARQHATHAFLQVNDDNAPALTVYRRYGFATAYAYHYRARPGECR